MQQTPLPFASQTHRLEFIDGTNTTIAANYVSKGTMPAGSTWAMVRPLIPHLRPHGAPPLTHARVAEPAAVYVPDEGRVLLVAGAVLRATLPRDDRPYPLRHGQMLWS